MCKADLCSELAIMELNNKRAIYYLMIVNLIYFCYKPFIVTKRMKMMSNLLSFENDLQQ